jgi:hypothetical protein
MSKAFLGLLRCCWIALRTGKGNARLLREDRTFLDPYTIMAQIDRGCQAGSLAGRGFRRIHEVRFTLYRATVYRIDSRRFQFLATFVTILSFQSLPSSSWT